MKHSYFVAICVFSAVIAVWYLSFLEDRPVAVDSSDIRPVESVPHNTDFQPIKTSYKVCISGEVNEPGVYEIESGDRVADVIEMAGGTTQQAELYGVNLARYVEDEDNIVIPKKGEESADSIDKNDFSTQNGYNDKVNINTADKQTLMNLDGIGEKIAQNVIEYRNENNGFKTIEEIKNVNRIGDALYNNIKDKITV